MRSSQWYVLVGLSFAVALGWGCGGGGGCGGTMPLPKDPVPTGFPRDQQIEGGIQARITKPGFDKLSAMIPELAKGALSSPTCIPKQQQNVLLGEVSECDSACGN